MTIDQAENPLGTDVVCIDVGLAAAAIGARVYLFAKGINDRQLYVRRTV